jgi:uncharacterized repeat protein (TIGR03803 family)
MKTLIKNLFLLPVLLAGLGLILTGRATAQTFTTLHSFTGISDSPPYGNSDGVNPDCVLVLSGNTLYGTANEGGTNDSGTVFAINTNGTNFTTLHTFSPLISIGLSATNRDGTDPRAGLILSGNTLYGTAYSGGTNGNGTVFAVSTNGSNFTNLHTFTALSIENISGTNSDGAYPVAGLILSGNTLYGTASQGGTNGYGTVFAVTTNGTGFTALYTFSATTGSYPGTNSDGANPYAGLILSGTNLFGTTEEGGTNGYGTVFAVTTNGTGFTNLHSFTVVSDGADPSAGLILSGTNLYGTASQGGTNGYGTVFAIHTDGTGFTNLYSFTGGSDGADPSAGLILSSNTLYGTASQGGTNGYGTVFAVTTNGTGFTTLHSFSEPDLNTTTDVNTNSDGYFPASGLILSGNTLYGTAFSGGTNGEGTVFSLSLGAANASPPKLTIIPSGTNVILTWPTNATGFTLESATNLVPPAIWITNAPPPVVVGTNNAVTNGISGTRKFYRLSQ